MAYLGRPSAGDSPFAIGDRALHDTTSPQPPAQRNPAPRRSPNLVQMGSMAPPSPYGSVSDEARRRYEERYARKRAEEAAKAEQERRDEERRVQDAEREKMRQGPSGPGYGQLPHPPAHGHPGQAHGHPGQGYGPPQGQGGAGPSVGMGGLGFGTPLYLQQQQQQQQQQQAYGRPPPGQAVSQGYQHPPQGYGAHSQSIGGPPRPPSLQSRNSGVPPPSTSPRPGEPGGPQWSSKAAPPPPQSWQDANRANGQQAPQNDEGAELRSM